MTTTFFEYLEGPYLLYPYLTGFAISSFQAQFDQRIESSSVVRTQHEQRIETDNETRSQFDRRIYNGSHTFYAQFDQKINDDRNVNAQFDRRIESTNNTRAQFDQKINDDINVNSQFDQKINNSNVVRSQFLRKTAGSNVIYSQFDRQITNGSKVTRFEYGRGPVSHQICDGYLVNAYLTEPYLATKICAHLRTEFHRINTFVLRTQYLQAIYNTKLLRILCDFPSRGTSGTNWSVITGGTAVGDFSVNNLNTDLVEEIYRSLSTTVIIQCDTEVPQGIFTDTLGILGHNLTRSAQVTMQGSNDPTFVIVGLTEILDVELENMYWISQYLPQTSYRYWRFTFSDPTNANNLQIGTIVFGPAIIFNGECFIDEVVRKKIHFADRVRTEGYTSVSNDRALKRAVSLAFRRLDFNRDNYTSLSGVIDSARTSLKCLWIPTPEYPSRFAVFGKLAEIPVENHKVIGQDADYIDLDITVDESL
jgi:hypothetical protein